MFHQNLCCKNVNKAKYFVFFQVYEKDRLTIAHYLDCIDEDKSNWMRFVNCARFEEEQNLIAEQYDGLVFYKAYKKILPGDVRIFLLIYIISIKLFEKK